jgi:hypothetical protein
VTLRDAKTGIKDRYEPGMSKPAAYGICQGMQGHVQNDREIFVRDLCQRRHSISSM